MAERLLVTSQHVQAAARCAADLLQRAVDERDASILVAEGMLRKDA